MSPSERTLWFMGQICAGGHALAAWGLGSLVDPGPDKDRKQIPIRLLRPDGRDRGRVHGHLRHAQYPGHVRRAGSGGEAGDRARSGPPVAKGAAG